MQVSTLSFDAAIEMVTEEMVVTLEATVLGSGPWEEDVEWIYPYEDWWQAFKDRWFPTWLKKRYPVRTTETLIATNRYNVCPHIVIELPNAHLSYLAGFEDDEDNDGNATPV